MNLSVPLGSLEVFLLTGVRIAAFLVIAPPFAHRGVPMRVKAMLAVGLGILMGPRAAVAAGQQAGMSVASGGAAFIGNIVIQVVAGAALGFLVALIFAAVQAAGDMIDLFGGFQVASAFDPLSLAQGGIFSRFYALTAVVLLFATNAYQIVILGLARTFDALPIGTPLNLGSMAEAATSGITNMFLGAIQIAGPLAIVLFLADVGLGLLTRAAPALNPFALGFPLKILLTLSLGALAYMALPEIIAALTNDSVEAVMEVAR